MNSHEPVAQRLQNRIDRLPTEPGVYIMKDRAGSIFYVGKASNLRSRVRSYFRRSGDDRAFIHLLDDLLEEIEVVLVESEHQALLLENQLIKKHQPRFNVRLRDDKNFLSLRLNTAAMESARTAQRKGDNPDTAKLYPRLEVTRRMRKDGARYFGPYSSAASVRQTLRLINRHFGLRTCTDRTLVSRRRPCILFQMRRCVAPCTEQVDLSTYQQHIHDVVLFLSGRHQPLLDLLQQRMEQAAASLHYEDAAHLRDQMGAVRRVVEAATLQTGKSTNRDLVGYARAGHLLYVAYLSLRNGVLGSPALYHFNDLRTPDDDTLSSLLFQHYETVNDDQLPAEILLPFAVADNSALADWLSERSSSSAGRNRLVRLRVPQRGEGRRQLEIAQHNADTSLQEAVRSTEARHQALQHLQQRLRLRRVPLSIECFDVSTFQGTNAVAAKVLFVDGVADKSGYRRYNMSVAQQDDYAMLYEAISRRLRRGLQEDDLPDLLLVDGGKGQLSVAQAVCQDLAITDLALAGIAKSRVITKNKQRDRSKAPTRSLERLFVPNQKDPILLKPHTAECALIERIRDEAHRFAITFHRHKRKQRSLRSELDQIPGIGPKLRARLLRHFGSVKVLRTASAKQIAEVQGISQRLAETVQNHLNPDSATQETANSTAS